MWVHDVHNNACTKLWSIAANSPDPYFGVHGVPRSPSPMYSLPLAADAMARALVLLKSPPLHRAQARAHLDRRASVYIDSEAIKS
jgi:hypothetical protein